MNAWALLVDEVGRVRPVELLYGAGLLGGVGTSQVGWGLARSSG